MRYSAHKCNISKTDERTNEWCINTLLIHQFTHEWDMGMDKQANGLEQKLFIYPCDRKNFSHVHMPKKLSYTYALMMCNLANQIGGNNKMRYHLSIARGRERSSTQWSIRNVAERQCFTPIYWYYYHFSKHVDVWWQKYCVDLQNDRVSTIKCDAAMEDQFDKKNSIFDQTLWSIM